MSSVQSSKTSLIINRCETLAKMSYGQDKLISFIRAVLKDAAWFLEVEGYFNTHSKVIEAEKQLGHVACVLSVSRVPYKINSIWQNSKKIITGTHHLLSGQPLLEANQPLTPHQLKLRVVNAAGKALYNILSLINLAILKPVDLLSHLCDLAETSQKMGLGIKILSVVNLGFKSIILVTDIIANKQRIRRSLELILIGALLLIGILYFAGVPIPGYVVITIGSCNAVIGLYKAWRKLSH